MTDSEKIEALVDQWHEDDLRRGYHWTAEDWRFAYERAALIIMG